METTEYSRSNPDRKPLPDLKNEISKLDYDHKLQIKRILLDKVLLAAVFGVFGYIASINLESFKHDKVYNQFLTDKRIEALQNIRIAFNSLSEETLRLAVDPDAYSASRHSQNYKNFVETTNMYGLLFSSDFGLAISHHAVLHFSVVNKERSLDKTHYEFIYATMNNFDYITRLEAIPIDRNKNEKPENSLNVKIWSNKELTGRSSGDLFDALHIQWKSSL